MTKYTGSYGDLKPTSGGPMENWYIDDEDDVDDDDDDNNNNNNNNNNNIVISEVISVT